MSFFLIQFPLLSFRRKFFGHAVFATTILTFWRVRCRSQVAGLLRNPDTVDEVWDEWLRYAP